MPLKGVVLTTGGAGFIGSHLVEALLAMEDVEKVMVLDDLSTGSLANLAACLNDDRLELVREHVEESRHLLSLVGQADYVFHLAARASVQESMREPSLTHRVNVGGSLAVLEAAREADVKRLVLASSCAVYGEAASFPISEDVPARPISPYGASKLAAEAYWLAFHEAYGLKTVVLRYFNVYGPRQRPGIYGSVILNTIGRVLKGLPPVIYGDGKQTRDFVHVSDVVRATLLAAEKSSAVGQVINVGSGVETTVEELIKLILELMGRTDLKPICKPPRKGDIRRSWADISKARALLGYEPEVSLEQGLRELIRYISWDARESSRYGLEHQT